MALTPVVLRGQGVEKRVLLYPDIEADEFVNLANALFCPSRDENEIVGFRTTNDIYLTPHCLCLCAGDYRNEALEVIFRSNNTTNTNQPQPLVSPRRTLRQDSPLIRPKPTASSFLDDFDRKDGDNFNDDDFNDDNINLPLSLSPARVGESPAKPSGGRMSFTNALGLSSIPIVPTAPESNDDDNMIDVEEIGDHPDLQQQQQQQQIEDAVVAKEVNGDGDESVQKEKPIFSIETRYGTIFDVLPEDLVTFARICLAVSSVDFQQLLAEVASSTEGRLDAKTFCDALRNLFPYMNRTDLMLLLDLYKLLDRHGIGTVEEEVLMSALFLLTRGKLEEKIDICFLLFGDNLGRREMYQLLRCSLLAILSFDTITVGRTGYAVELADYAAIAACESVFTLMNGTNTITTKEFMTVYHSNPSIVPWLHVFDESPFERAHKMHSYYSRTIHPLLKISPIGLSTALRLRACIGEISTEDVDRVFESASDSDGNVSKESYRRCLETLAKSTKFTQEGRKVLAFNMGKLFELFDVDGVNHVPFIPISAAIYGLCKGPVSEILEASFLRFDTNKDDRLSQEEAYSYFSSFLNFLAAITWNEELNMAISTAHDLVRKIAVEATAKCVAFCVAENEHYIQRGEFLEFCNSNREIVPWLDIATLCEMEEGDDEVEEEEEEEEEEERIVAENEEKYESIEASPDGSLPPYRDGALRLATRRPSSMVIVIREGDLGAVTEFRKLSGIGKCTIDDVLNAFSRVTDHVMLTRDDVFRLITRELPSEPLGEKQMKALEAFCDRIHRTLSNHLGVVSFKQLCVGLAALTGSEPTADRLHICLILMDTDGEKELSEEQVLKLFSWILCMLVALAVPVNIQDVSPYILTSAMSATSKCFQNVEPSAKGKKLTFDQIVKIYNDSPTLIPWIDMLMTPSVPVDEEELIKLQTKEEREWIQRTQERIDTGSDYDHGGDGSGSGGDDVEDSISAGAISGDEEEEEEEEEEDSAQSTTRSAFEMYLKHRNGESWGLPTNEDQSDNEMEQNILRSPQLQLEDTGDAYLEPIAREPAAREPAAQEPVAREPAASTVIPQKQDLQTNDSDNTKPKSSKNVSAQIEEVKGQQQQKQQQQGKEEKPKAESSSPLPSADQSDESVKSQSKAEGTEPHPHPSQSPPSPHSPRGASESQDVPSEPESSDLPHLEKLDYSSPQPQSEEEEELENEKPNDSSEPEFKSDSNIESSPFAPTTNVKTSVRWFKQHTTFKDFNSHDFISVYKNGEDDVNEFFKRFSADFAVGSLSEKDEVILSCSISNVYDVFSAQNTLKRADLFVGFLFLCNEAFQEKLKTAFQLLGGDDSLSISQFEHFFSLLISFFISISHKGSQKDAISLCRNITKKALEGFKLHHKSSSKQHEKSEEEESCISVTVENVMDFCSHHPSAVVSKWLTEFD